MQLQEKNRWLAKFANAWRGIRLGTRGQNSFYVHLPVALAVIAAAWLVQCSLVEFSILLLCVGLVLVAELANSAVERLARGLCNEHNDDVGAALDIASAAVLVASIFAAAIGFIIFCTRLYAIALNT